MFIFRLYACFDHPQKQGFDITLAASNEKEAIIKAKETVNADKFIIREVTQKALWGKTCGQEGN